jgi:chitinase
LSAGLVAGAALAAALGLGGSVSATAPLGRGTRVRASYAAIPSRVFAPYFETYTTDNTALVGRASSARYLTLAFLEAPTPGSCAVYWDGDRSAPVSPTDYGPQIGAIRAAGGDVVVSGSPATSLPRLPVEQRAPGRWWLRRLSASVQWWQ